MSSKVDGVRSVSFGVADPHKTAKFFSEIWGLGVAGQSGDDIYLRGTGSYSHIVSLHQRPATEMIELSLSSPDRAGVDESHRAVTGAGCEATQPGPVDQVGGGYGFTFVDPDGRRVPIVAEDVRHRDTAEQLDKPVRIGHVVLISPDFKAIGKFYCDVLGFEVRNQTPRNVFIRCNSDHHNIAFFGGDGSTLDHVAFLMPEVDSVVRGVTRMNANGYHMGWGVSQHGDGEDVYAYFCGPDGLCIEYTTKVDPGWGGNKGEIEHWDVAEIATDQLNANRKKIPFRASA